MAIALWRHVSNVDVGSEMLLMQVFGMGKFGVYQNEKNTTDEAHNFFLKTNLGF